MNNNKRKITNEEEKNGMAKPMRLLQSIFIRLNSIQNSIYSPILFIIQYGRIPLKNKLEKPIKGEEYGKKCLNESDGTSSKFIRKIQE